MDPAPIGMVTATLGAASGLVNLFNSATGAARAAREWAKSDPETQAALIELSERLADAKLGIVDLKEQLAAPRDQLLEYQRRSDLTAKRSFKDGAYFLNDPPLGYEPGLDCTGCWDTKGTPVLLRGPTDHERMLSADPGRKCPSCRQEARA